PADRWWSLALLFVGEEFWCPRIAALLVSSAGHQREEDVNNLCLRNIRSIRFAISGALLAAVVGLLSACATPAAPAGAADKTAAPDEARVYRTGSNLPQRESAPSDVKTVDPASINRTPKVGSPTTGSGG